jgi:predicted permease
MMALAGGVIWNFTGLGLAAPIDRFLDLLGSAAIPVALVAVGGRLAYIRLGDNLLPSLYVGLFKLLLMPLAVYLTAQYVFALAPLFVATITVLSAMPTGVFMAVFAAQYQSAEAEASSTIMVTTLLSAVTIALWLGFFSPLLVG